MIAPRPRPGRGLLRWGLCLGLALASGGSPSAARADEALGQASRDVADEAQFHFLRGNQFYRQARYEDALAAYYASNRLVANRNVQFNIARCLEQLKLYDEAFRAWSELLRRDLPPDERTAVEASIDRLRPHLALVQVTTTPPGAVVYANRRDLGALGVTPKLLALPPGSVTLVLDLPGFRSEERQIELTRGKELRLALPMERIYGQLAFRGLPGSAVVRSGGADGEVIQKGPGTARLIPGRHVLFVDAPGFTPARLEADVRPDATTSVDVPLSARAAPTGAIVVRANLDGALVRVDGKEVGFTPTVIEGVPTGPRVIELSKDGRETLSQTVEVRQGERAYVDAKLRRAQPEVSAATKQLVRAEEAPGSISVLTAEEIRAFGYLTVAQALAGIRGVISSNDRTYESIGFRGLSPPGDYTRRVLVLVDGHPSNEIIIGQGYVAHDLDIDLANVERIEVVRGPGSVLYGTAALFGVVNVVTRRPAPGAHAEASTQIGTPGLNIARATASGRGRAGELMASAAFLDRAGEPTFAWSATPDVARMADGERARHADAVGRLGPLSLRLAYNDRTREVPTGNWGTRPEPGTTYRDVRAFAELRLDQALGAARVSARLAYDYATFRGNYLLLPNEDAVERLQDDFQAQWATAELRVALPALGSHRLTLGGEGQSQFQIHQYTTDSSGAVPLDAAKTRFISSAYAVDDWAPSRRLRVNLGLRLDHYTYERSFGSTLNPRLAVIGRPYEGGNTKLLFGRAFRAPSPYELYYNDGGVTQTAPESLRPEVILSAELEHSHALDDDLTIVGSVFGNQLTNLILLQETSTPDVLVYANATAPVRGVGAEAEVRWEPGAGTLLTFAYAWQRTRIYLPEGAQPLQNAPEHVASLRGLYAIVPSYLVLGNEVVFDIGRRDTAGELVGDALIWNVTLSGSYRPWRMRYFAGVFNMLDDRTPFPVGREVESGTAVARYGRSGRLGISFAY